MEKERIEKHQAKRRLECDLSDPEFNRPPKEGHGFIYRYTFKNGKCYIGQTIQTIKKRARQHKYDRDMLVDSIIRSGAKFTVDILSEVEKDSLDQAESFCISYFNTYVPNGYNQTSGGQTNRDYSETTLEKMRIAAKRRMDDPKIKEVMSKSVKKYWATHPEARTYMAESARKRHVENRKKIICLETGKVYDSYTEAANDYGIPKSDITCVLNGKLRTAGKQHWIEYSEYNYENREWILDDIIQKHRMKDVISRRLAIKIKCVETKEVFESINDTSRWMSIPYSSLQHALRNNTATHGYHFKKVEV